MTQTDKNPFTNMETSTAATKSPDKQDLDFSFFDDSSAQTPQQSTVENNDFSFFDEPLTSKQVVQPDESSTTNFNFDDDHAVPTAIESHTDTGIENSVPGSEEPTRHRMIFTCLKCTATEDVDLPNQYELDLTTTCSSCSSPIRIILESNTKRATQKSTEIYCCNCGHSLDHHVHCPSCGVFCPDYYMVEDPAEAQRKARVARSNSFKQKIAELKSSLTWSPREEKTVRYTSSISQRSPSSSGPGIVSFLQNHLKLLAATAVVVLCVGIAVFFYFKQQAEQKFMTNYIKATYAVHIGSDAIITAMTKTTNDWKGALTSGYSYTPRTDSTLEARSARINAELSKLMQELQDNLPKKYEQSYTKLQSFQNEYRQLQNVTATPPLSYEKFSALTTTSEQNIKQKRQDLKTSLDKDLLGELVEAKKKFKGFNDF